MDTFAFRVNVVGGGGGGGWSSGGCTPYNDLYREALPERGTLSHT